GFKMLEGIFVGYEENRVGWKVRDVFGKEHFSDQVVFNEGQFGKLRGPRPQKSLSSSFDSPNLPSVLDEPVSFESVELPTAQTSCPKRALKLTERGKEWREGIRKRDELLNERRL
ncbi:hypothetical protein F5880DRAFT_1456392, partial [Lentinula raphanica]